MILCQAAEFNYEEEMLTFLGYSGLSIVAEIFISNSGRISTICGSRISNEEVWIKVETVEKVVSGEV